MYLDWFLYLTLGMNQNLEIMKNKNPRGLFDEEFLLRKLHEKKRTLPKIKKLIPWETFRPTIEKAFPEYDPSKSGRPPLDRVMMFKVLVLQSFYNLSDQEMEYQMLDRYSFRDFLDLQSSDRVPDEKTIWAFREQLQKAGIIDKLYEQLRDILRDKNLIVNEGVIVDASIVESRRQRNSKDENDQIKKGEVPEDWKGNPNKLSQKDMDARWLKKNRRNFFGYKNHIKIDRKNKFVTEYQVGTASEHDSVVLEDLIDKHDRGQEMYADSAYSGKPCKELIRRKGIKNRIHNKAQRGKPLSAKKKEKNTEKSRVRARVEHIFGHMNTSMNSARRLACVGIDRAAAVIGLRNISYNMYRYSLLIV